MFLQIKSEGKHYLKAVITVFFNRKDFLVYNVFKEVLALYSRTVEIQHLAIRETERKDP